MMNDQMIIDIKIEEKKINELLKMIETSFEYEKTKDVLRDLIPFQQKHTICFSVEELGLLRLTKKACVNLADSYLNSELHNQAKIIYEFILKYFPEDNDVIRKHTSSQLELAIEGIQNYMYNEARSLLNEIIKKNRKHISAMINLGVLDVLEQKFDDAKRTFQKVLEIEPGNDVALENLQHVMQTKKRK